ncbi:MAG: S8 family serine peptidase [Flavobacteriales bacterium]|nr:S8 family serine peptidase [Flavobacteriales bacterium]
MLAAQNYINKKWVQSTGQPDNLNWTASTLDVYHDLIVVGNTQTAPGVSAVLVTKYDALGDELWQRTYSGTAGANNHGVAVVTNASGEVFVAATLSNSGTDLDLAVLKYDLGGTLAWVAQWNGPSNLADVPAALALDSAGNIFICGASFTDPIYADFALVKISPAGTVLWSKTYDHAGLLDAAVAVEIDPDGHAVVLGISAPNNMSWDIAALRYDGANGDGLDTIRVEQPAWGLQDAKAMHMDEAGNIYVTGSFQNGTDKNVQTLKLGAGFGMAWLVDHDEAGFDDEGLALAVDDSGYVYVCGAAGNGNGGTDFLTLKYDPEGELVWKRIFAPKGGPWPCKASKLAISGGQIVVTGTVNNDSKMNFATVVYEPDGTLGWSVLHHQGYGDDQALMLATKTFGVVYVSGISETPNGPVYTTVKYDVFHKENEAVTDTSGHPLYLDQEVMVKFRHHLLDTSIVDNKDWQHGTLAELVPDSVAAAMEIKLGLAQGMASRIKVVKVFRRWTRADSISISRLGEEVRLPKFWSVFVLDGVGMDPRVASDSLSSLWEYVAYAHPNFTYKFFSNDPVYAEGWQSNLSPTTSFSDAHINVDGAWAIQTGQPFIKVGIVDTPVDWGHEDFTFLGSTKIRSGSDYRIPFGNFDPTLSPYPYGSTGYHGTACASILGSLRNNELGVSGIAGGDVSTSNSGTSVIPLIVGTYWNNFLSLEQAAPAIVEGSSDISTGNGFGCHVLNVSWGSTGSSGQQDYPLALVNAVLTANRNGCSISAAHGNYGTGTVNNPFPLANFRTYPSALAEHPDNESGLVGDQVILSIGATGSDGTYLYYFSNNTDEYQINSCFGFGLDLVAPGSSDVVFSALSGEGPPLNCTDLPWEVFGFPSPLYSCFQGTSSAAPHVAGVAALMHAEHSVINGAPNGLAPEDIEHVLQLSAKDIFDLDTQSPPYEDYSIGYDNYHGHGRLDASAALTLVSTPHCVVHSGESDATAYQQFPAETITIPERNLLQLPAGEYNAYRVEVTHTYVDEFPMDAEIISPNGAWGRESSTFGTHGLATTVNNRTWATYDFTIIGNVANVIATTNTWYVQTRTDNSLTVNAWYPAPPTELRTAYSLLVVNGDCWGPSTVHVDEAEALNPLVVYPNPAYDLLHVVTNDLAGGTWSVDIVDPLGRIISSHAVNGSSLRTFQLPIGSLARGTYFLRLSGSGRSLSTRFIKQ